MQWKWLELVCRINWKGWIISKPDIVHSQIPQSTFLFQCFYPNIWLNIFSLVLGHDLGKQFDKCLSFRSTPEEIGLGCHWQGTYHWLLPCNGFLRREIKTWHMYQLLNHCYIHCLMSLTNYSCNHNALWLCPQVCPSANLQTSCTWIYL